MSPPPPKVSVIVSGAPAGDGDLDRLVRSLDAQSLPEDEFEVILVGDGAADDPERLRRHAGSRPNIRVAGPPESGHGARSAAVETARGEYVLFLHGSDTVLPDGLRAAYQRAADLGADLVITKESTADDGAWDLADAAGPAMPPGAGDDPAPGPDAAVDDPAPGPGAAVVGPDGAITAPLPLLPRKLYRRKLLLGNGIRFPDAAADGWDADWLVDLAASRSAGVVADLADVPVYCRHAPGAGASHPFDPAREDDWLRLGGVMQCAVDTLGGDEHRDARTAVLAHHIRRGVIDRVVDLVRGPASRQAKDAALGHAAALLERYGDDDVLAALPRMHRAHAALIRSGRADLMPALDAVDRALTAVVVARSPRWDGGTLRFDIETRWEPHDSGSTSVRRQDCGVLRQVGDAVRSAVPPELLDVTDPAPQMDLRLAIRDRLQHITWPVPARMDDIGYAVNDGGALCVIGRGSGSVTPDTAAAGRSVDPSLWDLSFRMSWDGIVRTGSVLYGDGPVPAVVRGRAAVAYSNSRGGLSLDLGQHARSVVSDAVPRPGFAGPIAAFSVPLQNLAGSGTEPLAIGNMVAIAELAIPKDVPAERQSALREDLARLGAIDASIVVEDGRAFFRGSSDLVTGNYTLYTRRNGALHRTRYTVRVDGTGNAHFGFRS